MAIILIAVVLAVITGLNNFGKPISRTMWLAGALHRIVDRSGPDTVDLFTFLTLSDFQSFANDFAHRIVFAGQPSRRRGLPRANPGSELVLCFVDSCVKSRNSRMVASAFDCWLVSSRICSFGSIERWLHELAEGQRGA
jgi:hypothetical protein